MKPQAREKHLHLFRRGVLRFIQNDKGIVQGTAPHKRQGSHFDVSALNQAIRSIHVHHGVQGIIQRTQIRMDLGNHVTRQKSQSFTGLNRRPSQHNVPHFFLRPRRKGHGHGHVRLPGARRANADDQVVSLNGFKIHPLRRGLRNHRAFRGHDRGRIEKGGRFRLAALRRLQDSAHVFRSQLTSSDGAFGQFTQQPLGAADRLGLPFQRHFIAAGRYLHVQTLFNQPKV